MRTRILILFCIIVALAVGNIIQLLGNTTRMFTDAVPDEETAIMIAQTVLMAMYGEDILLPIPLSAEEYLSRVFEVTYNRFRRVWIVSAPYPFVEGVLLSSWTPEVVIRMRDARVISVTMR